MVMNFLDNLVREQAVRPAVFDIHSDNFIDQAALDGRFIGDNSYFEVVIHEIFLKHQRELWVKYVPLGVTVVEALYNGNVERIPYILGPKSLNNMVEQLQGSDDVVFRNIPVAGPQPFLGDWLKLFAGLWRNGEKNFADDMFSFVETIGTAVNIPQLSTSLAVARPLANGLEAVFGMNGMQLKVAHYIGYPAPPPAGELPPGSLKPGYIVAIQQPENSVNENEFWVRDNRLFFGRTKESAKPYDEADYLLLSIQHSAKRSDYRKFPFYQLFKESLGAIWEHEEQREAEQLLNQALSELAGSPDFVTPHRHILIGVLRGLFLKERAKKTVDLNTIDTSDIEAILKAEGYDFGEAKETAERQQFSGSVMRGIEFAEETFQSSPSDAIGVNQDDDQIEDILSQAIDTFGDTAAAEGGFDPGEMMAALQGAEGPFIYKK